MAVGFLRKRQPKAPRWPYCLNPNSPQSVGLVAWWPMDPACGTKVFDLSCRGLKYDLTNNGPTVSKDIDGNAAFGFVSGSSQYLERTETVLTAAPLTMCCWASFANRTAVSTLMCLGVNTANGNYFELDMAGPLIGNPIRAGTGSGTSTYVSSNVNGPTSDNTWHHCAGVFAAANSRTAYFNATAGTTNTTSRTPAGLNRTEIGRLLFESGSITNYLNGRLRDARVYDAALSPAVIYAMYDPATRYDLFYQLGRTSYFLPDAVSSVKLFTLLGVGN